MLSFRTVVSFFLLITAYSGLKAETVAVVFFENLAKRRDTEKLQLLLPLSIAVQLKNSHSVLDPIECQRRLASSGQPVKTGYPEPEMPVVAGNLGADWLITGEFITSNSIYLLSVRAFSRKAGTVFHMFSQGELGFSSAVMVKESVIALKSLLDSKSPFQTETVKPGIRLLILSDLPDHLVNRLMGSFTEKKFRIMAGSGTDFQPWARFQFRPFADVETRTVSYYRILPDASGLRSPAMNYLGSNRKMLEERSVNFALIEKKLLRYSVLESEQYGRLSKLADYALIIGADSPSWKVRLINLKTRTLVYFFDGISSGESPENAAATIITHLARETEMSKEVLRRNTAGQTSVKSPEKKENTAAEEKAVVAILNFYDRTGTRNYTWMSSSLADAINQSMQQVFEFNRAPEKVQTQSDAILKEAKQVDAALLEKLQKATGCDYIIFGDYTYNKKEEKIKVQATIYDLFAREKIGSAEAQSPTDSHLFSSVDDVAKKIVKDIFEFASRQNDPDPGRKKTTGKDKAPSLLITPKKLNDPSGNFTAEQLMDRILEYRYETMFADIKENSE